MMSKDIEQGPAHPARNIAETLAEVLPQAHVVVTHGNDIGVYTVAVPKGHELREVDLERLAEAPRHARLVVQIEQVHSFLEYVARHACDSTAVWCHFDPQTFALDFTAVFDDLGPKSTPGWRGHRAIYKPEASAEFKTWAGNNGAGKAQGQAEFAAFLERNEVDIAAVEGMPTSLQMMTMATAFEANSDKRIKSVVKLQGGGARLDFVDDNDAATEAAMKVFEKFAIGIPVFWAGPAYRIDARLKYRQPGPGKVVFWYELIRADRVHESAARELIERVREGIPASVPLLFGAAKS